ncbi:nucleosome assembly protein 1;4-like [Solanum pennellii]|uniref:Nucleosome assembly protein 14-like n=1 Tax=Solanum pennellii TaxID=28526 RepID=A0ABM1GYX8_SOLPN|nr:nucleosome assembly protein 1;4-like [Solanum pennellii]
MSTLDIYQSHLYPFTADAVASYAEYRAGLEIKQKDNLRKFSGSPSLKLKSLSPQVRKRVEALKNLQGQPAALKALLSEKAVLKDGYEKLHESLHTKSERDALQALFLKEKTVLEAKYEKLHESLHMKRYEIVNGIVEVEGDNMGTGDEKGIPNFWLTAMKAFEIYEDEMNISPGDEEALKYLKDIKCCSVDHPKGFKLEFFFDTNPFFKNSVLTKTCHKRIKKDMANNITWTDIEWYPGKCLTKRMVKCNPNKKLKNAKPMIRNVDWEDFFNFFKPPRVTGLQCQMQEDYEIGSIFRNKIIPQAVKWFTRGVAEKEDEDSKKMEYHFTRHVTRQDNFEEEDNSEDDYDHHHVGYQHHSGYHSC